MPDGPQPSWILSVSSLEARYLLWLLSGSQDLEHLRESKPCLRYGSPEIGSWDKGSSVNRFFLSFFLNFILFLKFYIIVLVLPNIKMDPPQVYMCSPPWTLLPPPSPYHPSGSSQCTSPKHPLKTQLIKHFIQWLKYHFQLFQNL